MRPTAVVVFEDALLLSLYTYCSSRKIAIPDDLTVVLLNYNELFEWMCPQPMMMRFPLKAAVSHFQQWLDGGLKPVGTKLFDLEMIQGTSTCPPRRRH